MLDPGNARREALACFLETMADPAAAADVVLRSIAREGVWRGTRCNRGRPSTRCWCAPAPCAGAKSGRRC